MQPYKDVHYGQTDPHSHATKKRTKHHYLFTEAKVNAHVVIKIILLL